MGPLISELGKKVIMVAGPVLAKKGVEKLFTPKKAPFISELSKKVIMVAGTALATAAATWVVDTAKKQHARRNATSDSNGLKKEH